MDEEIGGCKRVTNFLGVHYPGLILLLVPILLSPLLFIKPHDELRTLYVVIIMAIFWISEVLPLQVTSFIPIVAFPLMGIMSTATVASHYFKDTLMLFFAGLVAALGIEYCNLHKRLALNVIYLVGCSPIRLHWSLSICTTFISMWISNAAATAMMCPIIKALLQELDSQGILSQFSEKKPPNPEDKPYPSRTALAFYLSVAYNSTIGGCGTLIGTGTNVTFLGLYDTRFPTAQDIDFMNFMFFNVPPMIVNMILTTLWLQLFYLGLFRPKSDDAKNCKIDKAGIDAAKEIIKKRIDELGPITCHEIQVGIWFLIMIVLLIFRSPGFVSGWAQLFTIVKVKNSMPIVLTCLSLFLFPINYYFLYYCICKKPPFERTAPSLLAWQYIQENLPWGLLFLLAGGFALAAGMKASGLAVMLGSALKFLEPLPVALVQLISIVTGTFLTAFSSNVAMCNILVPILMEMAVVIKVHPGYLGLPACIALSMAFHFPVSTPCNAIVSGVANVQTKDMFLAGWGPTLITIFNMFLFFQFWGLIIYPKFSEFPDWAVPD